MARRNAGDPRWGTRYSLNTFPPVESSKPLDLTYITQAGETEAPWETRDWTAYVRPDTPYIRLLEFDPQIAPYELVWRIAAGSGFVEHTELVPAVGGAFHIAANTVGCFLRTRGLTPDPTSPDPATGAIWVAPGQAITKWKTHAEVSLAAAAMEVVEFPQLATGRFQVITNGSAVTIWAVTGTLPIYQLTVGANLAANQGAGDVAVYGISPGNTGIRIDAGVQLRASVLVEVYE